MQLRASLPKGAASRVWRPEPFFFQKLAQGLVDVSTWILAGVLALTIYFEAAIPAEIFSSAITLVALMVCLQLGATLVFRLHRQNWVKFSFRDARSIAVATCVATAVGAVWVGVTSIPYGMSIAIVVLHGLFAGSGMLVARGLARYYDEVGRSRRAPGVEQRNVVVIGAGEAGSMLIREMQRHPEAGMRPFALIDDDSAKVGRTIGRVPVVGGIDQLPAVLEHGEVDEILIALPSADGQALRRVIEAIRMANPRMPYRTMPSLADLIRGAVTVSRVRDVEIDDLLRRPPVELDVDTILGYLHDKTVMVTGAGGSIGSELVRQICRFGPRELVLFGHGENSIFQLERELDRDWPTIRYHSIIGAVQNLVRLEHVFGALRPDVVFHTAAHKHVPLMELNPEEAVFNNIVGTRNLVHLSLKFGVSHFVNISTDKAVNPTSVMGASKRMVELLVEKASREARPGQVFTSVRFGNVLGSRGSAVPIFKQQIKDGGPVTITDPEMVRYFMTIPEASQLVLQASADGRNGEIYILDMGDPIKVVDLVRDLIRLSGLEPDVDIKIRYTGIRPGEKLVEELMSDHEKNGRTTHDKIFVARQNAVDPVALDAVIEELITAAMRSDGREIRRLLGTGGPVNAKLLTKTQVEGAFRDRLDPSERVLLN